MIRIIPPKAEDGRVPLGIGTRILNADGSEIEGITRVSLSFSPDEVVEAEVTVLADAAEAWALPFMSEQAFLEAAQRYGYRVEKEAEE